MLFDYLLKWKTKKKGSYTASFFLSVSICEICEFTTFTTFTKRWFSLASANAGCLFSHICS